MSFGLEANAGRAEQLQRERGQRILGLLVSSMDAFTDIVLLGQLMAESVMMTMPGQHVSCRIMSDRG
eukprot:1615168-Rhodomonas_salina.1